VPPTPLRALELAEKLAIACALAADEFPAQDQGGLADQLRRAANSVALNLAEGAARVSLKDYRRFVDAARASGEEVKTALRLAVGQHRMTRERYDSLEAVRDEAAATIYGLLRYLSNQIQLGERTRRVP
jgi:four helix bundle protein